MTMRLFPMALKKRGFNELPRRKQRGILKKMIAPRGGVLNPSYAKKICTATENRHIFFLKTDDFEKFSLYI